MFFLFLFVLSVQSCTTFINYDFTQSLDNGWTVSNENPTPYIATNHLIVGDLTTETAGYSSVYQDFTISSCTQVLAINYTIFTKDNNVLHDQQYIQIKNPTNDDVVATLYGTLMGFNLPFPSQWFTVQCNVCDGTCGGIDLLAVGVSPLRLEFKVHQAGNFNGVGQSTPTALIIKDVCLS